jgi:hypothetical protein
VLGLILFLFCGKFNKARDRANRHATRRSAVMPDIPRLQRSFFIHHGARVHRVRREGFEGLLRRCAASIGVFGFCDAG